MGSKQAKRAATSASKRLRKMAAVSALLTVMAMVVLGLLRLLNDWSAVNSGHGSLRRAQLSLTTSQLLRHDRQPSSRQTPVLKARHAEPVPHWDVEGLMQARNKWARTQCYLDPRSGSTENILVYFKHEYHPGNPGNKNDVKNHTSKRSRQPQHVTKNVTGERDVKSVIIKSDVRIIHGSENRSAKGKTYRDRKGKKGGRRRLLEANAWSGGEDSDGLSYCVLPKAGCTFWIRVFRLLNNDTGGVPVTHPFQISRTQAHDAANRNMKMFRLERPEDKAQILKTKRILFAREPFSRLYSAFLDKFFLPDYWKRVGKKIVRQQRKNATELSKRCGHDVTFVEFLRHILTSVQKYGPRSLDGHWRPIQHQCSPCEFQPDYIGLHETFAADAEYILRKHGLAHLWSDYNHDWHVLDEMQINTHYMFSKAAPLIKDSCTTKRELCQRLWKTFQMNGYLPLEAELDAFFQERKISPSSFLDYVSETYSRNRGRSLEETTSQRRLMLARAYSEVPSSLLQDMVDVYSMDFKYFGYNSHPPDIFPVTPEE